LIAPTPEIAPALFSVVREICKLVPSLTLWFIGHFAVDFAASEFALSAWKYGRLSSLFAPVLWLSRKSLPNRLN
jgi:hypothetical protein